MAAKAVGKRMRTAVAAVARMVGESWERRDTSVQVVVDEMSCDSLISLR